MITDERLASAPNVTPWERTVAIYRVARKAGARLRARDLIHADPERWWAEYTGPMLNRISNVMAAKLHAYRRAREEALGLVNTPPRRENEQRMRH